MSVISRLQRSTNRFLWVTRLRNISVVVFVAWLAYDSAVRDDLTILTCFIPMFLLMISPQFSVLSKVWHSVTHVETVAELWRKYDLETRPPNDRTAATT